MQRLRVVLLAKSECLELAMFVAFLQEDFKKRVFLGITCKENSTISSFSTPSSRRYKEFINNKVELTSKRSHCNARSNHA